MPTATDEQLEPGVDPNAAFWAELLAELRTPDLDDLGEQVRELAKSQIASDRFAFAVHGSRSEQPLPHGHPRQHKSILQVDALGGVLAQSPHQGRF